jgi:hypothetical protein
MIDQYNLITVDRFGGDAYSSSQAVELALNGAILRAEISRSYEEFLEILEKFYADDVEVSSEGAGPRNGRGGRHIGSCSTDCGSSRHCQRDAFRMEARHRRRERQTVHFEMVRHSQMEGSSRGVRAPLRS